MRLSIEGFLLNNFLMDILLLWLALRAAGRPVKRGIWAAGLIGALYAWAEVKFGGQISSLPAQGLVMLLMLLLSGGAQSLRPREIAAMAAVTLAAGGALDYAARQWRSPVAFFCTVAAFAFGCTYLQNRGRLDLKELEICIRIGANGQSVRLKAFVDTGNRVTEPLSGLPVLIAEERKLECLLQPMPPPMRKIPYGALGGSGFLDGFRPDRLEILRAGVWCDAPPAWVALYPGKIAWNVHALAPAALALRKR